MRIAAWWSFYIDAPNEKEVLIAIGKMETALGHPIQVEAIENSDERVQRAKEHETDSIFLVEAWSFLHAQSIEQAAVHTLKQVQKLDNTAACFKFNHLTPDDDWDGFFTASWSGSDDNTRLLALPQFQSCSVQLSHFPLQSGEEEEEDCDHLDDEDKEYHLRFLSRVRSRPALTLPPPDNKMTDYIACYQTALKSSTNQKLMNRHWPKLQQIFSSSVTMTELQKRPYNKGAFHFTIRQELNKMTEEQAIITCLSITGGNVKIQCDDRGRMTWFGTANQSHKTNPEWQGISGFSLERKH